jgi:TolB-like protein/class 3 adenylate cyclase/Flp pilus assembly protein TadD
MERRLAAIVVADVVGYSRLMAADEAGTLAALKDRRKAILDPVLKANGGRIVKVMGDGVLVEFASAVKAVEAAVELQHRSAAANADMAEDRRILLRIGINLGEVIGEASDIYGDGVNIAARLESLAEPGGICISAKVYEEIRGKTGLAFESMGEQTLKNIDRPVLVYRFRAGAPAPPMAAANRDKPSIAVLPFQNMSGDPEQEYLADGIVEEIITALSRFRQLFVIARNSSFTYKGRAVDVKQVGRDLAVHYVLEGSVRRAGGRVRITGQLIDAASGAHLWADRFEGGVEDIFDLQDQVTARVVAAIAPKLEAAEIERTKHKPTESLDAYDEFLRGMAGFHQWSKESNEEGLRHFYRAIQLDPNYAAAYGMAARMYVQANAGGWVTDRAHDLAETERLALKAAELGPDDAVALANAGFALSDILGHFEDADAMLERALALNPNLAWAWLYSAWVKISLGESGIALERIEQALKLSPNDPQTPSFHLARGSAQFYAGRFAEAFASAETAIRLRPGFLFYICVAAASAALDGRMSEAQRMVARMLQINPALRLADVATLIPMRRAEDSARWVEGLRKAGVPE